MHEVVKISLPPANQLKRSRRVNLGLYERTYSAI
jgi:hypothetical protein